jgi:hypothetical protein
MRAMRDSEKEEKRGLHEVLQCRMVITPMEKQEILALHLDKESVYDLRRLWNLFIRSDVKVDIKKESGEWFSVLKRHKHNNLEQHFSAQSLAQVFESSAWRDDPTRDALLLEMLVSRHPRGLSNFLFLWERDETKLIRKLRLSIPSVTRLLALCDMSKVPRDLLQSAMELKEWKDPAVIQSLLEEAVTFPHNCSWLVSQISSPWLGLDGAAFQKCLHNWISYAFSPRYRSNMKSPLGVEMQENDATLDYLLTACFALCDLDMVKRAVQLLIRKRSSRISEKDLALLKSRLKTLL